MNRELKFRGMIKETGKCIYGQVYYGDGIVWITDSKNINLNTHSNIAWFEIIPETVGQFTGLFDVNGKEIYEGDIIKMIDEHFEGDYKYYGFLGKIEFNDGCYGVIGNGEYEYINLDECSIHNYHFEKIGNIHQHPHLLKN